MCNEIKIVVAKCASYITCRKCEVVNLTNNLNIFNSLVSPGLFGRGVC